MIITCIFQQRLCCVRVVFVVVLLLWSDPDRRHHRVNHHSNQNHYNLPPTSSHDWIITTTKAPALLSCPRCPPRMATGNDAVALVLDQHGVGLSFVGPGFHQKKYFQNMFLYFRSWAQFGQNMWWTRRIFFTCRTLHPDSPDTCVFIVGWLGWVGCVQLSPKHYLSLRCYYYLKLKSKAWTR